jgi:hypothetical protein
MSGDSPPSADRKHTRVLSISLSTSGMRRKRQEKLRRPGSQQEVSVFDLVCGDDRKPTPAASARLHGAREPVSEHDTTLLSLLAEN